MPPLLPFRSAALLAGAVLALAATPGVRLAAAPQRPDTSVKAVLTAATGYLSSYEKALAICSPTSGTRSRSSTPPASPPHGAR